MRKADQVLPLCLPSRARVAARPAFAAGLLTLSVIIGTTGLVVIEAAAATSALRIEPGAKSGSRGDVAVDVTYHAIEGDTLLFRVAMDTMKMDQPPLAEHDLVELARLVMPAGSEIRPARWTIEQTGHMGHHVRGTLAFKLTPAQRASIARASASFAIVVKDLGALPKRTFSFKATPGAG